MHSINNPHDRAFRQSLKNIEVARDFLATHIPPQILAKIDLDSIKFCDTSYIDPALREHLADIVYQATMPDQSTGYFCCLIEHQSKALPFMPLKLLRYQIAIMENYLFQNPKANNLPIVFALLFYNGTQKPYPFSLNILDLFCDRALACQTLFEPALLIDVTQITDQVLKKHKIIGLLEWSQKHIRDRDLSLYTRDLIEIINNLFVDGLDLNHNLLLYIKSTLCYILSIGNIKQPEKFIEQLYTIPTVGGIMGSLARKWQEEGKSEGLLEGRTKGKVEGLLEGKKEVACAMLTKGIDPSLIKEVTKLTVEEVNKLKSDLNLNID